MDIAGIIFVSGVSGWVEEGKLVVPAAHALRPSAERFASSARVVYGMETQG